MKHLIMVGACSMDIILTVPFFPSEDSKLRATDLNTRRGGNCPNSLEVLQQFLHDRQDIQAHLVSCMPNHSSEATRKMISSFGQDSKVNFNHCIYREDITDPPCSYIIRSEESGSRTIVNHNVMREMTAEEFERIVQKFQGEEETWWHFEGRIPDVTLECFHILRKRLPQARISVEVEKPGREGLPELAAEADVVFYSRSWAESRGHASAEACVTNEKHSKASLALCTWGADGVTGLSRASSRAIRCKPLPKDGKDFTVVDAVGAGDTFIAGTIYGLFCLCESPRNLEDKMWFATTLATLKVQHEGFAGLRGDMMETEWKDMVA